MAEPITDEERRAVVEAYRAANALADHLNDFDRENADDIEAEDFNIGQDEYIEVWADNLRKVLAGHMTAQETILAYEARLQAVESENKQLRQDCEWADTERANNLKWALDVEARMKSAVGILGLIAAGWIVIESDGDRMTIQAPDDWNEVGEEGDTEMVVDTRAILTPSPQTEGEG